MPQKAYHLVPHRPRLGFLPILVLSALHTNSFGEISPSLDFLANTLGSPVEGRAIATAVARYHGLETSTCLLLVGKKYRAVWSVDGDLERVEALARELSANFAGDFNGVRDLRPTAPQPETEIEREGSL